MYDDHEQYDDPGPEPEYERDYHQEAKDDSMQPPMEEPPEGYYDTAAEWAVHIYNHADNPILLYSDETPDVEGETELTEETAWAIAGAINLVGAKMLDEDGYPFLSAAVLHRDGPMDHRSGGVRVGSVSPTDPAALGKWLRDRPDGTIFQGAKGLGWQLNVVAVTSFLVAPYTYRAMTSTVGEEFRFDEGHIDLDRLVVAAPFTVLALGEVATQGGDNDG